MSLIRNLSRAERIHRLIKFKRTGTPEAFAHKMDMSLSNLYGVLKELKELGAPIEYCRFRETYQYTELVEFKFGFERRSLTDQELMSVRAAGTVVSLHPDVRA